MALDQATQAAADAPLLMDASHQFSKATTVDQLHAVEPPDFKSPASLKQWDAMKAQAHNQILQTDIAKGQQEFDLEVKGAVSKLDNMAQAEILSAWDPKKPASAQSPEFFAKLIEVGKNSQNRSAKKVINEIEARAIAIGKVKEQTEEQINARVDQRVYNTELQKWQAGRTRSIADAVKRTNPKNADAAATAAGELYDKNTPKPQAPVRKSNADPLGLGIGGAKPMPEGQTDGDGQDEENTTDDNLQ